MYFWSHIADRLWSITVQFRFLVVSSFVPVGHVVGHPLKALPLLVCTHNVALAVQEVQCVLWVLLRKNCHHHIRNTGLTPEYGLLAVLKN